MRRGNRIAAVAAVLLPVLCAFIALPPLARAEAPVRVFAAASLTQPVTDLLSTIANADGVFASSGTLTRQIESGAPADIFISAHPRWSSYLVDQGIVSEEFVAPYIANRLVIVSANPDVSDFDFDQNALQRLLSGRLSIGDPAHVPAGQYAKQALQGIGIWDDLAPVAIRAGNVRAVVAYVKQRAVDYGIVYLSDAISDPDLNQVASIPSDSHDAILYTITLLTPRPAARQVYELLVGQTALTRLQEYGFTDATGTR